MAVPVENRIVRKIPTLYCLMSGKYTIQLAVVTVVLMLHLKSKASELEQLNFTLNFLS